MKGLLPGASIGSMEARGWDGDPAFHGARLSAVFSAVLTLVLTQYAVLLTHMERVWVWTYFCIFCSKQCL